MELYGINILAVGLAAVAAFAFGAAYYTILGKIWLDASGKTEAKVKQERTATPFITSFVGLVVMGIVLSSQFMPQQLGLEPANTWYAIHIALMLWVGFIVTSMATNNAFQGAKPKLTLIDAGHWLGVVVIQAVILCAFS